MFMLIRLIAYRGVEAFDLGGFASVEVSTQDAELTAVGHPGSYRKLTYNPDAELWVDETDSTYDRWETTTVNGD